MRNLDGMWSSIFTYMQASDFIYIGLTIALLALCIFFSPKDSHKKGFFVLAGISVIFCIVMLIFQVNHFKKKPYVIEKLSYNIFDSKFDCPCHKADFIGNRYYAVYFSPFLYFVNQIQKTFKDNKTEINFTQEEYDKYIQKTDCTKESKYNVIIVFFEGLEHWVVNNTVEGKEITPNINKLIKSDNSLLCCKTIYQVNVGHSSDAQLLLNTGLCPIIEGAVANRFFMNTFPNLCEASKHKHTRTIIPTPAHIWNQDKISKAYGYKEIYAKEMSDFEMFNNLESYIDSVKDGYFIQTATMASHVPFHEYSKESHFEIKDEEFPISLCNYLKSVNYTDSAMAKTIDKLINDPKYENTILVVIGDHCVFPLSTRKEYSDYFKEKQINININEGYVPCIIYSKSIKKHKEINEPCYQMDTYRTLLNMISDCYYWKGFGIDLLNNDSLKREYSEKDAIAASDKMIKGNFFSN
ncbi:MAG TPA: LTA synthase family protein [Paludibacteraceae bacterium]|nr:LTA synthase family protein [Paludibacteraceae bacterium]